jgi:hypothetical protein
MPEDRMNMQPHEEDKRDRDGNAENTVNEPFESDTQKIVRRHLENKDDVITDQDIAGVRVGMVPPRFDEATESRFEDDDAREEAEKDLLSGTPDMDKDENLDERQITPWDTIDPNK